MIDVIDASNIHQHRDEIQAMHRQRYRVFYETLRWDVPVKDGMERDRYDTVAPVYLLAFDAARQLVGSTRLLPTTGPYMLRDEFPDLLDGPVAARSPTIWEGSRLAVECTSAGRAGLISMRRAVAEIFCGVVETCLALGVSDFITVYDERVARMYDRLGCVPRWTSPKRRLGACDGFAAIFDITSETLVRLRRSAGIGDSVISVAPWKVSRAA